MMYADEAKRKRFNEVLTKIIELEKTIREMPDNWNDLEFMILKRDCGIYSSTVIIEDTLPKAEKMLQKIENEYERYISKSA